MEAFFERETQRLEFTTQRMNTRTIEKKAVDAAKMEQTVSLFCICTQENLRYSGPSKFGLFH